jgi:uncharacterized membrane protein
MYLLYSLVSSSIILFNSGHHIVNLILQNKEQEIPARKKTGEHALFIFQNSVKGKVISPTSSVVTFFLQPALITLSLYGKLWQQ